MVRRSALLALLVFVVAVLTEHVLEVRDAARLTTGDTFCSVHGRRVRYRLAGAGEPGPTTVLVSGFAGTIEQWHDVQDPLAISSPVLAYDRGGMGFSDASDAHDPTALADELADVLRAVQVSPPFVVVSYSSSALMARLFVERHEELVKGVVLLDPLLPRAEIVLPRVLMSMRLKALVGLTRLRGLKWKNTPVTLREEKEQAILASFHHWNAASAESLYLQDWPARLMAAPPLEAIPVAVLCTFSGEGAEAVHGRVLAAQSPRGTFLGTHHIKHSDLVTDAVAIPIVLDLIRKVENQAREPGAEAR
jgi:pimeloyl-ACP methyl ester carboxylesterase